MTLVDYKIELQKGEIKYLESEINDKECEIKRLNRRLEIRRNVLKELVEEKGELDEKIIKN